MNPPTRERFSRMSLPPANMEPIEVSEGGAKIDGYLSVILTKNRFRLR